MNIKKQARFLYRYLIASHRWRSLVNTQVLIVLAASAIFIAALVWTTPQSATGANPVIEATSASQTLNPSSEPARTPFPQEYLTNSQETIGIAFAGTVLVLIVVVGVIVFTPKKIDP